TRRYSPPRQRTSRANKTARKNPDRIVKCIVECSAFRRLFAQGSEARAYREDNGRISRVADLRPLGVGRALVRIDVSHAESELLAGQRSAEAPVPLAVVERVVLISQRGGQRDRSIRHRKA